MRSVSIRAGVLLLCACQGKEPALRDSARATVAPTPVAEPRAAVPLYSTIAAIDSRVDSIEKYLEREPGRLAMYAKVPDRDGLVFVRDSSAWPEEVESSFNLVTDSAGRLVLHREVPRSESGDWFAVETHYFAPDGQTIRYDYNISSFSSECTEVLSEHRRIYLQPGAGVLKDDRRYTDKDDKPIDAERCHRRSDDAPGPKRRAADLLLPTPAQKK